MKIYSWNMLFKNKRADEALAWIRETDFDVLCLQEVPSTLLPALEALPYHLAYASEGDRIFPATRVESFVAILSKHPFISNGSYTIPKPPNTRLSRIFMRFMRWAFIDNRNAVYVDVAIPTMPEPVRIISVHISLSTPQTRQEELALTFTHRHPHQPTIICGDFNVIESYKCAPLNTIMGGPLLHTLARTKERAMVETMFAKERFVNPLRGHITHPFSRSQLDHILVTEDFKIVDKGVVKKAFGSDHHPVFISV